MNEKVTLSEKSIENLATAIANKTADTLYYALKPIFDELVAISQKADNIESRSSSIEYELSNVSYDVSKIQSSQSSVPD